MKKLIMFVLVITIMGTISVLPVMAEDDDDIIFLYPEYNPLKCTCTENESISNQSSNNTDLSIAVIDNCIGGDEPWENKLSIDR